MADIHSLLQLPAPLVLASQSARRKALLQQIGLDCRVMPSAVDEEAIHNLESHPAEYVQHLALHKARDVAARLNEDSIVIGADTTVVVDGIILNKPVDEAEAYSMLQRLSNRTHSVYTGIALIRTGEGGKPEVHRELTRVQQTQVTFREVEEEEIRAYIATGSPMDKAGAYGIQDDFGAVFVRHIEGCYYTIVGLPLELLYQSLKEFCQDARKG